MNTTSNPAPDEPKNIPEEAMKEYEALSKNRVKLREKIMDAYLAYKEACDEQNRCAVKLVRKYGVEYELVFNNQADNEILGAYRNAYFNGYRDSIRNNVYGNIEVTEEEADWRASKINLNQVILSGIIGRVLKHLDYIELYLLPISTLEEVEQFKNKTHPFFKLPVTTCQQQTMRKIRISHGSGICANQLQQSKFLVGLGSIVGGTEISLLGKCFRVYQTLDEFLEDPQNQLFVSYHKIKLPFFA